MHDYETLLTENARAIQEREKPLVPLLIVEDDRSLLPIFDWIIRNVSPGLGYHWCSSLEAARTSLRHNRYGLIISDFLLEGGGNGLDVLELNAASPFPARFVLMTSLDVERFWRVDQAEAPRVITKPLAVSEVRSLLLEAANAGRAA